MVMCIWVLYVCIGCSLKQLIMAVHLILESAMSPLLI